MLKHSAPEELVAAVREALAGRTYITPRIAGDVLKAMRGGSPAARLTSRQAEVLQLLAEGPPSPGCALAPEAALRSWLEQRLRASSRVRSSERPYARLLLRAASEAPMNGEAAGLPELLARAAIAMRTEVEQLVARLAPAASPAAVSTAAGYFLLVGTTFVERAPELARFGLTSPQSEAELDEFIERLWRFLRAGVLALLSQTSR